MFGDVCFLVRPLRRIADTLAEAGLVACSPSSVIPPVESRVLALITANGVRDHGDNQDYGNPYEISFGFRHLASSFHFPGKRVVDTTSARKLESPRMNESVWRPLILAVGIVIAGIVVGASIIVSQPDPVAQAETSAPLDTLAPQPRILEVWMPKLFQLDAVHQNLMFADCPDLETWLAKSYADHVYTRPNATSILDYMVEMEWASLPCYDR